MRWFLAAAEAWQAAAHNRENPALYAVFPFRLFQPARGDAARGGGEWAGAPVAAALRAYEGRPFRCNVGWCQDAVQAGPRHVTEEGTRHTADEGT